MATRKLTISLLLAAIISMLAACEGGSTLNLQNQPPPATTGVSIAFQPAPPASMPINSTTTLTAVVSNDSTNAGVDWVVTCQNVGNCGSLSSLHTASSQSTTFTPPASLSGNRQTVNIVAYATANHAENVVAPIAIGAFGSALKGTYVMQTTGMDSSFQPYQFAGVIVLDGNGGVTSGEQTVNFYEINQGVTLTRQDPVSGGSYFVGADGRGTITLQTQDEDVGTSGVETFSFVFLNNAQLLIAQTDVSETGSGTMDLQTSIANPTGGYAFVVNGTDIPTASPVAMGGVFNIDSPNTISGKGSVTDQNLAGTITALQPLSGTISNPDSFGAVTIDLNVPTFPSAETFEFTGYIVDATHIKLIESDNQSGAGSGATGGVAIGQGSATGTFTDVSAFTGNYVFGMLGEDLDAFVPDSMTSAGYFNADGGGNLSGFMDRFLQANFIQGFAGSQISAQFTATYTVDAKGTGRVRAITSHLTPVPKPGAQPLLFFYLTGNGNPPLMLDGGDKSTAINYPSLGTGIAYPQASSGLTFSGQYGFNIAQQNGLENDGTGQMTADASTGTLTGVLDINAGFSRSLGNAFTDHFTAPSNGTFQSTLLNSTITVNGYAIDANHGFFIETDLISASTAQVSLGYYATRTPVCQGCP